jgi:hypothetical protein
LLPTNASVFFATALLAAVMIRIGYCIFPSKNADIVTMNFDLKKLKVPWITKNLELDLLKFPIDSNLTQTVSADE